MKNLTLITFLVIALSGLSQEDIETKLLPEFEFGINATSFIQNIIPFSDLPVEESNASSLFLKTGNGSSYFRGGFLFDFDREENDIEITSNNLFGLKVGVEKKKWISKSWLINYGGDLFGSFRNSKVKSTDVIFGEFESSEKREELGIAAVFGIQWMINDRMALSTESYFAGSAGVTREKQNNSPTDKVTSSNMRIVPPNSIYFSIYF